jgi:hypothetical protein
MVLCRKVRVRRRIEKPEWTVGGGYEVGGDADKLDMSWARDIVLPSDRGGGASSMKDGVAPSRPLGRKKACKEGLSWWERAVRWTVMLDE